MIGMPGVAGRAGGKGPIQEGFLLTCSTGVGVSRRKVAGGADWSSGFLKDSIEGAMALVMVSGKDMVLR